VVGTRAPTADGLATARALGAALARGGVTVVSGMARGIDQAAHRGALDGGGRTVAVLGTGLGVDYPGGSAQLRSAVADAGALLTELAPGVGPRPLQFLARNRIISGLADATVVVEGREKSGALQTARLAAAQGRDVWAVPGSINAPASAAPLALLRDGALPVTGIDDFVEAVTGPGSGRGSEPGTGPFTGAGPGRGGDAPGVATPTPGTQAAVSSDATPPDGPPVAPGLSHEASTVVALLGAVAASTDELAAATRLPVHAVLAAVGELVDAGVATTTPQGVARSASA
jgi:DNA processing protein